MLQFMGWQRVGLEWVTKQQWIYGCSKINFWKVRMYVVLLYMARSFCESSTILPWFNTLVTWCEELTHWKRLWCWERLRAGGEEVDREQDGGMASPTQWTWVWANFRRYWSPGKPGVLQSMGLQRIGHDWVTQQQPTFIGLQWGWNETIHI